MWENPRRRKLGYGTTAALFNEKHFQLGTVSDFRPKGMDTF